MGENGRRKRVLQDDTKRDSYTEFVHEAEKRLRQALSTAFGPEIGRDAAAEALVYGWEHWERLVGMENPVGYLYRVGRSRGVEMSRRRPVALPTVPLAALPWVEPGLPDALERLTEQQRTVVLLLHSYEWTMSEVADLLGISKASVQTHADRAMKRLRRRLKVDG
jgi:DNA-directed RNA polymerase specialized sigma24 family protein